PKDSAFTVESLRLNSSFAILEDGYEANISELSFDILRIGLDDKVSFESRFAADKQSFSLEKLVLATGNSLIQSSGNFQVEDSAASFDLQAQPLSWRDISAYIDQSPVEQNLGLDLQLKGNLSEFSIGLGIRSEGIDELQIAASLKRDTTITLTGAKVTANRLNLQAFFNDTAMPDIHQLQFESEGAIPLSSYREGNLKGILHSGKIAYNAYALDTLRTDFSLDKGILRAGLNTGLSGQDFTAQANISNLWLPEPEVSYTVKASNINPGYWLQDDQYNGSISFNGKLSGTGLNPEASDWDYRLDIGRGTITEQQFNRVTLQGKIDSSRITNKTLLRLVENEVNLTASLKNYNAVPNFAYEIRTKNFNLSEFNAFEDFNTALTFEMKGSGSGSSIENLKLDTEIGVDSSIVNGERIENFRADIRLEDSVADITEGELQSTIAGGSFSGRIHLFSWYDSGNELNVDINLKDLQSLAPLVGTESLQAEGNLSGKLTPAQNEDLNFTGTVDLSNLKYDELFSASGAGGMVEILVKEEPEYSVDLSLVSPEFSTVRLQDVKIKSEGRFAGNDVEGSFMLNFAGPEESELNHGGSYLYSDSTVVTTDLLEMKSSLGTLSLRSPFKVNISGQAVRMDTMHLSSEYGAMLELAVPYADSVRQQGYLRGRNLNLSVIQSTLLGESYFEGILSGRLSAANSDTGLVASADLSFSEINYRGAALDSLNIGLELANEQLQSRIRVIDTGDELLVGDLRVPFRLGDPQQFDESFFENRVKGSLRVKRLALGRFEGMLHEMGIQDTEGILRLRADLNG
ncbi:MAG: hypothetical protein ACNS64_09820, partial [Candidatus Halalkalibacterium sp. M3_1C_030]